MELIDTTAAVIFEEFFNPAIYLVSTACFVWFLYGVANFIWAKYNSEEEGIKNGKRHMLWGIIGLIIIFSASAIFNLITSLVS